MAAGDGNGGELVGRVLGGRYRVTAPIGRGGMGVVARAVDQLLNREVAVKILRAYTDASGAELADLRARMHREAQAAARIRHPSVVTVHDVTEEQGLPVIVMELVDGPSLDDVLTERGTVGPREAAEIGARLMDALDAAHRVGVLHRDVKPGNVLLERGGRVVLTDFGIASMEASGAPGEDARERLTRSGELVGSLDYLPPERARGMEPGPASDIWALGMTLYAAVEGASPFRRTSAWSTLAAIVTEPLPEPRLAGPLTPVLRALMAKEPADRPTADQARRMLEAVAAGGTPPAGPGNPPSPDQGPAAPPKAYPPLSFGPSPQDSPAGGPEQPQPTGDTPLPYGPRQPPGGDTPPLYGPRQQPGGDTSLPYGSQQPPGGDTPPPYGSYGPAPAPADPRFPQPDQQSAGEIRTGGGIRTHDAVTAGGHRTAPARARRRSRTVIAAAAAVVLVGGGTAYAVLAHQGGSGGETRASHSTAPVSPGNTLPSADGMANGTTMPGASSSASPHATPSDTPSHRPDPSATAGDGADSGTAGPTAKPGGTGGGGSAGKPPSAPATPSTRPSSVSKSCGGWSHQDPNPGSYASMAGSYHIETGPYQSCPAVALAASGKKVWFHCYVTNAYGNRWTYIRIAGTNTSGWMSNDNFTRQSGPSTHC